MRFVLLVIWSLFSTFHYAISFSLFKIQFQILEEDKFVLDFGSLLDSGKCSDLVLVSEATEDQPAKEFSVHKLVMMTRSPFFAAMFTGNFKEKQCDRLETPGVAADVLQQMIRYIYTERVEDEKLAENEFAMRLYEAADYVSRWSSVVSHSFDSFESVLSFQYQLEGLKEYCLGHLVYFITGNSSFDHNVRMLAWTQKVFVLSGFL